MMKKLLLSALFCAGTLFTNAQCVINTTITASGFYPDSLTGIPSAIPSTPYNGDIQILAPKDTFVFGQTIALDSLVINSIVGLPLSFSHSTNPSSGTFYPTINDGPRGCMRISGTANSGEENGGPNSDGVYPLIINYTGYITFGFAGVVPIPQTNDDYRLVVNSSTGYASISKNNNDFISYPNPANDQVTLEFNSLTNSAYKIEVYNYLGQIVKEVKGNNSTGLNKITLTTSDLSNGTYMYRLISGNGAFSKAISINH